MDIRDSIRGQLIDAIAWSEPDQGVLACRFPTGDLQIAPGAALAVAEDQAAAFVCSGGITDVLGPGRHVLDGRALPRLARLLDWSPGAEQPFRCDVYFFSTRVQEGRRWATAQPLTVRDPELGTVKLRGYGSYAYRIADVAAFFVRVSGAQEVCLAAEFEARLRNMILWRVADALGDGGLRLLDGLAAQEELARRLAEQIAPAFTDLGLALEAFGIDHLALPDLLHSQPDVRVQVAASPAPPAANLFQSAPSLPVAEPEPLAAGDLDWSGALLLTEVRQGGSAACAVPEPALASPDLRSAPRLKYCLACGVAIPRRAKFCPECGESQAFEQ